MMFCICSEVSSLNVVRVRFMVICTIVSRFLASVFSCLASVSVSVSTCLDQILMFWFSSCLHSCVSPNASVSDSITAKWTWLNRASGMFHWDRSADTQTVDVSSMLLMRCTDADETRPDAAWQLITAASFVAYRKLIIQFVNDTSVAGSSWSMIPDVISGKPVCMNDLPHSDSLKIASFTELDIQRFLYTP